MSELANQFFKAFIKNNRWQLYVKGLGNTLEVTLFAALLGLLLGTAACLLNMQRTKEGKRTLLSPLSFIP